MGLFGGFKAKFTKNYKPKVKIVSNVVVLRYQTHSEFDTPQTFAVPSNSSQKTDSPHVSKSKQRPPIATSASKSTLNGDLSNTRKNENDAPTNTNSTSKHTVGGSDKTKKKNEAPTVPRRDAPAKKSSNGKTYETPSKVTSKAPSVPKRDELAKKTSNGKIYETPSTVTSNDSKSELTISSKNESHAFKEDTYSSSRRVDGSFEQNTIISKSTATENNSVPTELSMVSSKNDHRSQEDLSPLIFMTGKTAETKDIVEFSDDIYDDLTKDNIYNKNEDGFKVNIVQHNKNRAYSISEDELSVDLDDDASKFTTMGYSSQATSIFFGGDMQPTINRPRRVNLKDEEDDDGDEVDC
ncbi:hypothetical protein JTB14_020755 [Gonioctena quinquepunctata]|nr:hypothetical protein JTB14_020755 [Gonioctena quinquepunctata]